MLVTFSWCPLLDKDPMAVPRLTDQLVEEGRFKMVLDQIAKALSHTRIRMEGNKEPQSHKIGSQVKRLVELSLV